MRILTGEGPLYVQVRKQVVARIVEGIWLPGNILPSETQLASYFGVSQGTVRKALDGLVAENLIVRHQGKGSFVAIHTPHRELFHFFHLATRDGSKQMPATSHLLSCSQRRGEKHELSRLNLGTNALVVIIERVRDLGKKPVILERIAVPAKLFEGLAESGDLPNELYQLYEESYGVTIHKAIEELSVELASSQTAHHLGVKTNSPLLAIERVAETLEGKPVEYRRSLCNCSHHFYLNEIV